MVIFLELRKYKYEVINLDLIYYFYENLKNVNYVHEFYFEEIYLEVTI